MDQEWGLSMIADWKAKLFNILMDQEWGLNMIAVWKAK